MKIVRETFVKKIIFDHEDPSRFVTVIVPFTITFASGLTVYFGNPHLVPLFDMLPPVTIRV